MKSSKIIANSTWKPIYFFIGYRIFFSLFLLFSLCYGMVNYTLTHTLKIHWVEKSLSCTCFNYSNYSIAVRRIHITHVLEVVKARDRNRRKIKTIFKSLANQHWKCAMHKTRKSNNNWTKTSGCMGKSPNKKMWLSTKWQWSQKLTHKNRL